QPVAIPPVIGANLDLFRQADFQSITTVANERSASGPVWLIEVPIGDLIVLGHPFIANAYLAPASSSPLVRRGWVLRFEGPTESTQPDRSWKVVEARQWAQVADSARFVSVPGRAPTLRERPFIIEGTIPDSTLLSLVRFIRTSPSDFSAEHHADG